MADYDSYLNRWLAAGVLDEGTARQIRDWEDGQSKPSGLRWQGILALVLGGILLACGVVLFVSAHWDRVSPGGRFTLIMAMVALFHLAGGWVRDHYRGLSTALHAVGTVSTGAAIALVGQIFNIQEHWPAAILLWGIAALAGWILLQDEVQQILTLLLFPAWMLCELVFYSDSSMGRDVGMGRFCFIWGFLFMTRFLSSQRRVARGVLFSLGAIASIVGFALITTHGLGFWDGTHVDGSAKLFLFTILVSVLLPLLLAIFRPLRSLVPVGASVLFAFLMPMIMVNGSESNNFGGNLLLAFFAIFLIWWGVRIAEKLMVNYGVLAFAGAVLWFYCSSLLDKVGRSLGLIGLGILFLAGGWALEKARRKLVGQIKGREVGA